MTALLTIAIPTYNRGEQLLRTLGRLLPQLDERCELLVIDNHSDRPVAGILTGLTSARPELEVRIIRNPSNVGMSANILRCFELCRTPWIWVVGDDDEVFEDAYQTVCRNITANPDDLAISFHLDAMPAESPSVVTGHDGLFNNRNLFTASIFLSSTVYQNARLKSGLAEAYEYCGTFAPHSALLLLSLRESGAKVRSCRESILDWRPAEAGERYSMFFAFKLAPLLNLVDATAQGPAKKALLGLMTPVRRLLLHCLRDLHDGAEPFAVSSVFHEYVRVMAGLEGGVPGRIRACFWNALYSLAATFPRLAFRTCVSLYAKVRGKALRDGMQANRICRNIMKRLTEETSAEKDPSIS